ncbi:MAG: A/G-specific adenine glycosylase [Bacteroidota bacterium]|nr:A/G-specific adenine glycosylase [Bacteroidota bacterium]
MLQKELINWYLLNKRELPWRNTSNPYIIWLSEIILQQTRIQQGLPYFEKFLKKFPTIKKLASAQNHEIMKLWQGLGYYSRARNMHKTAKTIISNHKGKFPDKYHEIIKLTGIGPYTAAAIASFAFNEAVAVVDGNVHRVLSRYYAINESINTAVGKKLFAQLANDFLNKDAPATHNQAMMELGAVICKPQNPLCNNCPISKNCLAFSFKQQELFPKKEIKLKVKNRYLHYIFFSFKGKTAIHQRPAGDIWQNLYDLPLIEFDRKIETEELRNALKNENWFKADKKLKLYLAMQAKHKLTHQNLFATFWFIALNQKPKLEVAFIWVDKTDLKSYAISRLFEKFLISQNLI